jgi:signal transduction histidine kinase
LRLEPQPDNKELNELVDTFNDMLNRIETSFETQNHLIGNVSHELRTPLLRLWEKQMLHFPFPEPTKNIKKRWNHPE